MSEHEEINRAKDAWTYEGILLHLVSLGGNKRFKVTHYVLYQDSGAIHRMLGFIFGALGRIRHLDMR